jgi:hypothetical protein
MECNPQWLRSFCLRSAVSAANSVLPLLAALSLSIAAPAVVAQIAFEDVTAAANVGRSGESFGASFGDLNGDGYLEIFASNHRMRPSLFLNRGNGTFVDITKQTKPWLWKPTADTHGSSWFDFDNDGDQDLSVGLGTGNLPHFLVNEYGRLVDRTVEAGLNQWLKGNRLPLWLDYDGDRLPDLIWANHGGIARVFRQDTPGHFTDQTDATRFNCLRTHYGHLMDVTEDGRLDYLCPKIEQFPLRIWDTQPFPWRKLFDNLKPDALVVKFPLVPSVVDSTLADFDNDGRLDMFLLSNTTLEPSSVAQGSSTHFEAKLAGGNKGFRFVSSGKVTFDPDWNRADEGIPIHMARYKIGAGGHQPAALPFTLDPADPNVAGIVAAPTTPEQLPMMRIGYDPVAKRWTLQLHTQLASGEYYFSEAYVMVDSTQAITNLSSIGLWPNDKPNRPTLLKNESGGYQDHTVAAGLDAPIQCGSVAAGDYDNDMDIDLYLACRTGVSNISNVLYENLGGTFRAVSGAGGAAGPVGIAVASGAGTADSAIVGDYNVDGFLDLFVTNGLNLRPLGTGGPNKLFRNRGNGNNWIELDLVGKQSERDAVGARVYATANSVRQLRVQNGAYHRWSQDSRRAHFGLAGASSVDLRVEWPSGQISTFNDVAANRLYRITEGTSSVPTAIAPVNIGAALAYQCGPPPLNGAVDVGLFIWRDCPTGEWRMKTASGGGNITYTGTIVSSKAFTNVKPLGLESNDGLNWTSNPSVISFSFVSTGKGLDGANFMPQDRASNCLEITAPTGAKVYYGPFRTLMPQAFNLDTQQSCGA